MDFNPLKHHKVCHSSIPSAHANPTNPPPPPPLLLLPATSDRAPPVIVDQTYDEDLEYFKSLPPGFRFCPYDQELILCYLLRKIKNEPLPRNLIKEVQLYDQDPAVLVEKYRHFGEKEWYFFTSRTKKYKNGSRPQRATNDKIGYWKATGADKEIKYEGKTVGVKKTLVYHTGNPPNGTKTNWIMHEYRENDRTKKRDRSNNDMLLDPWVLCRVYKKNGKSKSTTEAEGEAEADGFLTNNDDDTMPDSMAANLIVDAEEQNFVNDIIVYPEEEQNGADNYVTYSGSTCELPPLPASICVSSAYQPTRFFHQQFSQPVYTPPIRRMAQFSSDVPPPPIFINGQMMVHGSFGNMAPGFSPPPPPPPPYPPYPGSINGPGPGNGFR
ncbi:hypothetical protein SLA2020_502770 [Shorea laevis]